MYGAFGISLHLGGAHLQGLYRYTRNPMYVGVLTVILGWAILFRVVLLFFYAVVVGCVFHLFIVFYEEHHLQRKFGDEYNNYRHE